MDEVLKHKSSLAEHPDVREVLPRFVGRLRGHVRDLRAHLENGEWEKLRVSAHQLRGAGASFGFAELTLLAGELEEAILRHADSVEKHRRLDALVGYMEWIEGY